MCCSIHGPDSPQRPEAGRLEDQSLPRLSDCPRVERSSAIRLRLAAAGGCQLLCLRYPHMTMHRWGGLDGVWWVVVVGNRRTVSLACEGALRGPGPRNMYQAKQRGG
jgi:hypothetical protein